MSATDKHYRYEYKGIRLDPYRIFKVYQITEGPQQHSIKKLLRAGKSVKSLKQDVQETIMTLQRWLEMMGEDDQPVEWPTPEQEARQLVVEQNGNEGVHYSVKNPPAFVLSDEEMQAFRDQWKDASSAHRSK